MRPNFSYSLQLIQASFSFLYLKKNSKIYVRFEIFQKYTPVALWGETGLKCNFFFFKFAKKSLEKKKEGGLSPPQRATGPCRPLGGATGSCVLAWPTKPIEFHSSSVRRFIVIYLQKHLEIEFELS